MLDFHVGDVSQNLPLASAHNYLVTHRNSRKVIRQLSKKYHGYEVPLVDWALGVARLQIENRERHCL